MSHLPAPTCQFINGIKECVCSACGDKLAFVQDSERPVIIGLACGSCHTFWPLVLAKEEQE